MTSKNPYFVTLNARADQDRKLPEELIQGMIQTIFVATGLAKTYIYFHIWDWYYGLGSYRGTKKRDQELFDNDADFRETVARRIQARISSLQNSDVNTEDDDAATDDSHSSSP